MNAEEIKIGLPVTYYGVIDGNEKLYPRATRVRSDVWALGSGEMVCKVDGIAGGVSIRHLEPR